MKTVFVLFPYDIENVVLPGPDDDSTHAAYRYHLMRVEDTDQQINDRELRTFMKV